MKSIDKLLAPVIFLSFAILSYYFLFYYPFAFNYEFDEHSQYLPAVTALCCWSLFLIILAFNKRPHAIQSMVMLIVSVLILYLLFSHYYSFGNEYFTNITIVVMLFAVLLSAGSGVLHSLLIFFSVLFFWQLYLAFIQMDGFSFNIQKLNVQGTLRNSGTFSCYIVCQLPFLYYLFFYMPNLFHQWKKPVISKPATHLFKSAKIIVFVMVFAFVAFIVCRSQSRTALIALGVLLLSFFMLHYGTTAKAIIYKLPKALSLPMACAFIVALGYTGWYLFNLKKLSALGRVMTLDIATDHLTDHFWLGTGIGRFTWQYPQWQAQYFAMHPAPSKDYFLSAGETYVLFNEYVQLFQTIGFPGFIALILLLIWFFTRKSTYHKTLLNTAKLTAITIFMCGFSSYPFHVNIMLLLLAFCFATAAIVNDNAHFVLKVPRIPKNLPNAVARLLPIIFVGIAGIAAYMAFGEWQAKQDWNKLHNQLDDSRAEIKREYIRLSKPLKYDGKFLTEYGTFLSEDSSDCRKACIILEEAKKYFISKATIEALAQAYKKTGDYSKAIENWEWLCHYLPNKFGTKLELLKLYSDTRDTVNAIKIARTISTMPVKMSSHEVDKMKMEAKNIVNGWSE